MLASVQERFDEVSYVVVDDFPTVDPDLVIVEVRGDNQRPRKRPALPEPLHHVPVLPRRPRGPLAGVLQPRRLPNGGTHDRRHDMTGVLDGLTVLDLTQGIAGPVAGMLLADHGAQVTKIEPPGGDPTRALTAARRCGTAGSAARCSIRTRPIDRDRLACSPRARRRAHRELRARRRGRARHRRRHAARAQPAARLLLDHRLRRRRRARRPSCGTTRWSRRAPATSGRAAACPAARSPASPASRPRSPTSCARRLLGRRAPSGSARSRACRG